jgi:hypothetical protein
MKVCLVCKIILTDENCSKYKDKRWDKIYFNSRCKECSKSNFRQREKIKRENLPDNYIQKKLIENGFKNINQELIESKRLIIKINRKLRCLKKTENITT